MTRRAYILVLLLAVATLGVKAQVKVTAKIDSAEMLIGEQTDVRVDVVHPSGQVPVFPKNLQELMKPGVEVVKVSPAHDEPDTPDKGKTTTHFSFTLTSFEPSLYYIPPINIKVGKKSYLTNQLALKVGDVAVDTAHVDKFFGPKEIIEPVYTWRDWMPMFLLSLLLIASCIGLYVAVRRLVSAKKVKVKRSVKKKLLPPHKEAEMEIQKLESEYSEDRFTSKDYYTSLVAILRKYVHKRYGINADEMTSFELVDKLIELGDKQQSMPAANDKTAGELSADNAPAASEPNYSELREILSTADLTKFAKLTTDEDEDKKNLMRLSEYIETTKSEALPVADLDDAQVEEKKPAEPRTKKKLVVALFAVVTAVLLLLLLREVFDLLL